MKIKNLLLVVVLFVLFFALNIIMDLFIWNKEMNLIRNGSTALGVAVGMLIFLLITKKKGND